MKNQVIEIKSQEKEDNNNDKDDQENEDKIYQPVPLATVINVKEEETLELTAEELRKTDIADLTRNLLFDQKSISLCKLFFHLCTGLDYLCLTLAILGSLGAGISMPMISFLSGDAYSSVGDSSKYSLSSDPLIVKAYHDMMRRD